MYKRRKCFTLIEVVITVAIIGIIAAVLIPTFVSVYDHSKNNIVEIYNEDKHVVCYYNNDQIIYEGPANQIPVEFKVDYQLADIKYQDNIIYLYYTDKSVDEGDS